MCDEQMRVLAAGLPILSALSSFLVSIEGDFVPLSKFYVWCGAFLDQLERDAAGGSSELQSLALGARADPVHPGGFDSLMARLSTMFTRSGLSVWQIANPMPPETLLDLSSAAREMRRVQLADLEIMAQNVVTLARELGQIDGREEAARGVTVAFEEIAKTPNEYSIPEEDEDVFWDELRSLVEPPFLFAAATVALVLVELPSGEAAVERCLSTYKWLFDKYKSRAKIDLTDATLVGRAWLRSISLRRDRIGSPFWSFLLACSRAQGRLSAD
jgi:hypothetical protein